MSRQDFDFGRVRRYYFPNVDTLRNILLGAPVLLFSFVAHEYAHGYAALKQGDPTARDAGRLTWNPIKHIDLWFTIIIPAIFIASKGMFLGGPKPTPVDPSRFRQLRRGGIIVSLAGVTANLGLALASFVLIAAFGWIGSFVLAVAGPLGFLQAMMIYGVFINFGLILFNLMPIPPLDGSQVISYALPPALSLRFQQVSRYGLLIVVVLVIYGGRVIDIWMRPATIATGLLLTSVDHLLLPTASALLR